MRRHLLSVALSVSVVLNGGILAGCGQTASESTFGPQTPGPTPSSPAAHAWAVGDRGTILATTDGGRHWSPQQSGTKKSLAAVAFADAQHGWAVGCSLWDRDGSVILATTDGGERWQTQLSDHRRTFHSVSCTDARHAWVISWNQHSSGGGSILATTDGGAHWTVQASPGTPLEVAFADNSRGWLLAGGGVDEGTIYGTTDGGSHWVHEWTPPGDDRASTLTCSDARHCWVTASHWTFTSDPASSAAFESPATVWATSDGGATWGAMMLPQDVQMHEVSASSPVGIEGVAVVYQCSILVSAGSGQWIHNKTKYATMDVAFSDASHGWLVTWDGGILTTTNGGDHWVKRTRSKETIWALACPRSGE